ncbi:hypothetical protein Tco_1192997 [Tanacetum coccineum]
MNIKFRGGLLGLKRLHGFLEVTAAQGDGCGGDVDGGCGVVTAVEVRRLDGDDEVKTMRVVVVSWCSDGVEWQWRCRLLVAGIRPDCGRGTEKYWGREGR